MKKIQNKKASAAALVLLSLLAVVAGALFTLHSYDKFEVDRSRQNEISTEASITLSRAISLGINDFALNGFSKYNKYWYCNYPLPPYIDEADESVDWFVEERIRNYIQALREQGKFVNMPEIKNDVDTLDMYQLDFDSITYDVSNYIVGVETDEFTEKQDISNRYTNPFTVWLMYKNFYEWMEDNAGHLTENIYTEVFENKACQAISTDCDCPGNANGRFIKDAAIDEMKLEIEDVYPALDKSLEELNYKFAGTGITCDYRIEKYHIENEEKLDYTYSANSYLDQGKTDVLDWNQGVYNYDYKIWYDDFTLPNPGQDELGGCPTTDPQIDATYREQRINVDVDVDETASEEYEDGTCTSNAVFELFHVEEFALNKKLGLLVTFYCSDPSVSIESPDGLKPFTGEVGLRVSVRMDCPVPSLTYVNGNEDDSFFCGGGGGGGGPGPIGVINCPIECPECQLCAMEGEDYVCIPEPGMTPCGEDVCMVCDNAGQCTLPAPLGMQDDCPGDCNVCDGVNTGVSACILGEGGLAEDYACSVPCYVCSADATCDKIPEDFSEIDSSLCGDCQACGLVNGLPACMPDVEENGDECGESACNICQNGACVVAGDGFKDSECGLCEVCVSGGCGYSAQFSGSLDECGTCQACGEVNGDAACVADISEQGQVCGGHGCSTCQGTECKPDPSTAGNLCARDDVCQTTCDSQGYCRDGSATQGNSCDANLACMSGVCQSEGNCGIPASFYGKQCCGDILCNAGDPCCPNGAGIGRWTCSACDDITT